MFVADDDELDTAPPQQHRHAQLARGQRDGHSAPDWHEAAGPGPGSAALAAAAATAGPGLRGSPSSSSSLASTPRARQPHVQRLAEYAELPDRGGGSRASGLRLPAAAVACSVGLGCAVLVGTHPELPASALSDAATATRLADSDPAAAAHAHALAEALRDCAAPRRRLWASLLLAGCGGSGRLAGAVRRAAEAGGAGGGPDPSLTAALGVVTGRAGQRARQLAGSAAR